MSPGVKLQCGEREPGGLQLVSRSLHSQAWPEGSRPRGSPQQRRQGIVIEHTEQVKHHRWASPGPEARGLAPLDGPTRALLHQLRWRKTPPSRGRRWLALGIVLVLHGLFGLLTWHEMRWQRSPPTGVRRNALEVRLIARPPLPAPVEASPPAPALPAPVAAPVVARPRPVSEPSAKQATTVSLPSATSAPAPAAQLYDAAGQAQLPSASSAATAPATGYVQRMPQGDAKLMQHDSPVSYQPTRFDKDWQKGGGSSVDDALKRAVDSTTVKHTFHIAPGVRVHCAISFAALAGGCGGDPPPAPPSKDGDVRLNMAPANVLAPGAPASTPPSVDECIAIYRADKPLPQGCPVDTPTRSVDAEMRERAARQGG